VHWHEPIAALRGLEEPAEKLAFAVAKPYEDDSIDF
jgi:hypothetical protein